jgi:hydrogenase small subunit
MAASLAAGMGLGVGESQTIAEGLGKILTRQAKVLWLSGMSCTGCSVSFLNADEPGALKILTEIISLVYHSTVSAAQGEVANEVIQKTIEQGDYYLVVEGAVPLSMPESCVLGGQPFAEVLARAGANAKAVIAAGTCSAFGGIPAAEGNPTTATSVRKFFESRGIPCENRLVNCPGCPMHPQSLLGTVAYVVAHGYPKVNPQLLTPDMFYKTSVHDDCPRFHYWEKREFAAKFGDEGCLFKLGCLGPLSHAVCPQRQWNGGVNWCIRAGAPCVACTSEGFAMRRDFPFYRKGEEVHAVAYQETDREGLKS